MQRDFHHTGCDEDFHSRHLQVEPQLQGHTSCNPDFTAIAAHEVPYPKDPKASQNLKPCIIPTKTFENSHESEPPNLRPKSLILLHVRILKPTTPNPKNLNPSALNPKPQTPKSLRP